jgi:hypothetical protein
MGRVEGIRVVKRAGNPGRTADTGNKHEIVHIQFQFVDCPQDRLGNRADTAAGTGRGAFDVAAGIFFF